MPEPSSPEIYSSPLAQRFASREMLENFSELKKFRTWRRVWVALAEAEHELGVKAVTEEQIQELRAHQDDINLDVAREFEAKFRHDVMAHVHAYGKQCPNAAKIIHLGATSCDITDNADIIIMRDGLLILRRKLVNLIDRLGDIRRKIQGLAHARLDAFPARATDDRRQARVPVGAGFPARPERNRVAARQPAIARDQGRDRDADELPRTLRRQNARRSIGWNELVVKKLGFDEGFPGHRPDVSAQARRADPERRLRHRAVRAQVRQRHPAPAAPARNRGAVRGAKARSARRRWRTSATRCAASGSPAWRGS